MDISINLVMLKFWQQLVFIVLRVVITENTEQLQNVLSDSTRDLRLFVFVAYSGCPTRIVGVRRVLYI
jgi:hypothetical protein